MKKLKKKTKELNRKNLLAALAALVVVGGVGYGVLKYYQPTPDKPQEPVSDQTNKIYEITAGEIYPEWKKLINHAAGYSIEFPPEGKPEVLDSGALSVILIEGIGGVEIRTEDNPSNLTAKAWAEDAKAPNKKWLRKEQEVLIDKNTGYSLFFSGPANFGQWIYIAKDNKMIKIDIWAFPGIGGEKDDYLGKELPKILSAFRALN